MSLQFSAKPGPRERHLKRKYQNPLFPLVQIDQADIDRAHVEDSLETERFLENFRNLVEQAINLSPNADADDILKLKAVLEQNYTRCMGLGGDMEVIKQGFIKLLEVIMQSLIKAANGDAEAMQRIDQEMEMMKLHFQLSESLLFSDFLHEKSIITEDEIIPTLLSASEEDLQAVLHIFNAEQLTEISQQIASTLPEMMLNQSQQSHYQKRVTIIEDWLREMSPTH